MIEPIDPDDLAALESAKEEAHAPLYAPISWFLAAGRKDVIERTYGDSEGALEPFSFARRAAFQRIGAHGSLEVNVLLVYLCIMPRAAIDHARPQRGAEDRVSAFRERMETWADAIGVRFDGSLPCLVSARVGEIADAIWQREDATESTPVLPKGKPANPNA